MNKSNQRDCIHRQQEQTMATTGMWRGSKEMVGIAVSCMHCLEYFSCLKEFSVKSKWTPAHLIFFDRQKSEEQYFHKNLV